MKSGLFSARISNGADPAELGFPSRKPNDQTGVVILLQWDGNLSRYPARLSIICQGRFGMEIHQNPSAISPAKKVKTINLPAERGGLGLADSQSGNCEGSSIRVLSWSKTRVASGSDLGE